MSTPSSADPPQAARQRSLVSWAVAVLFWVYYLSPVVVISERWESALLIGVPGLLAMAALVLRHRRTVLTVVLVGACLVVSPAAAGAALAAQATLAHRTGRASTVALSAAGLVVAKIVQTVAHAYANDWQVVPSAVTFELLLLVTGVVIATLAGRLQRSHEEEAVSRAASERARYEAEQARLAEARLAERSRIAREMHDVVAHRISLVAMHAGVLAHTVPDDEARGMARLIQSNARDALAELRVVLADLRGADAPPEPPQPTLAELPVLVADAREAGQRVDLDLSVDLGAVPPQLSRQAYRIIQEGLTNARKHAPGAPVTIEVAGRPGDRLVVEVTNPLADLAPARPAGDGSGSGLGLVGVGERAELLGGSVTYGVRDDTYELTASLPWEGSA